MGQARTSTATTCPPAETQMHDARRDKATRLCPRKPLIRRPSRHRQADCLHLTAYPVTGVSERARFCTVTPQPTMPHSLTKHFLQTARGKNALSTSLRFCHHYAAPCNATRYPHTSARSSNLPPATSVATVAVQAMRPAGLCLWCRGLPLDTLLARTRRYDLA